MSNEHRYPTKPPTANPMMLPSRSMAPPLTSADDDRTSGLPTTEMRSNPDVGPRSLFIVHSTTQATSLLAQNLFHRLSFCELINQLVQVANSLHQRIFNFFHADTAHDASDQRTTWVIGWCLSVEGLEIDFLFD